MDEIMNLAFDYIAVTIIYYILEKHLQSKRIKYSLPTSSENWLSADNPKNPYAIQKKINCFFPI